MEARISAAEEARIGMQARILRCPLGGNPEDCPLHDVREYPMEERLAWLQSKTDEEVVDLYRRHSDCLLYKLSEQDS